MSTFDSQDQPSRAYCIRWEPVDDPEAGCYITLKTALDRLTRDSEDRDGARAHCESLLRRGGTCRTAFAYYRAAVMPEDITA